MAKWDIKKLTAAIEGAFAVHEASAMIHVEPFAKLLMDNPDEAIEQIGRVYNRALDDAYTDEKEGNVRAFVEAIAGGPCETIPWALYNAIGAVYPFLERPQKDKALGKIFGILDRRNWAEVNGERGAGHTTGIREPLLLSDIAVARDIYWPGLHDQEYLWKGKTSFKELQLEIMTNDGLFRKDKVRSDFLVGYALLRSDFSNFGEDYLRAADPEFLDRTLRGIVALRFAQRRGDYVPDVATGTERLKALLPRSVHDRIEPLRLEGGWVDYKKFP
jgi:hypothetical protein